MEYMELLQRHDGPKFWEHPRGFDYRLATARFAACAEALSSALGLDLQVETGTRIQDASFHSQVLIPLARECYAMVRFSNFGDMVSIGLSQAGEMMPEVPLDHIQQTMLRTILEVLEKHGYVYVPAEVLLQPYTGQHRGVTGIRNWWIRYFDWV